MGDVKQLDEIKRIGRKLRRLRLKHKPKKLTLHEVAEAVGYSTATLSQIERGVIAPSIQGLLKLADFYKVSPASFFDKEKEDGGIIITSPAEREHIKGDFGEVFELMHNNTELDTVILRGIVPPGSSSGSKFHNRDYSEFVYVSKGSLKVISEDGEYRLDSGDALFVKANTPFRLAVDGNELLEGIFIYFGRR